MPTRKHIPFLLSNKKALFLYLELPRYIAEQVQSLFVPLWSSLPGLQYTLEGSQKTVEEIRDTLLALQKTVTSAQYTLECLQKTVVSAQKTIEAFQKTIICSQYDVLLEFKLFKEVFNLLKLRCLYTDTSPPYLILFISFILF